MLLRVIEHVVLRILIQEGVIQINHFQLLDVISGRDLLRVVSLVLYTSFDP